MNSPEEKKMSIKERYSAERLDRVLTEEQKEWSHRMSEQILGRKIPRKPRGPSQQSTEPTPVPTSPIQPEPLHDPVRKQGAKIAVTTYYDVNALAESFERCLKKVATNYCMLEV